MAFLDVDGLKRVLAKLNDKFAAEATVRKNADDTLSASIGALDDMMVWHNATGSSEAYANVASM